jgi:hypothetical protein
MKNYNILVVDTNINTKYYKRKILKNEPKILKKYPPIGHNGVFTDGYTGLGENSLTSRFFHYNVLSWWGVNSLKREIKKNYFKFLNIKPQPIYVQCWSNVMRRGEQIKPHIHRVKEEVLFYSPVSGNLIIDVDQESYTYYDDKPILNLNARMVLFSSDILHYTSVYTGNSERISIAFDIRSYIDWKLNIPNHKKSHWIKI